jgi:hypothetical protein
MTVGSAVIKMQGLFFWEVFPSGCMQPFYIDNALEVFPLVYVQAPRIASRRSTVGRCLLSSLCDVSCWMTPTAADTLPEDTPDMRTGCRRNRPWPTKSLL